MKEDLMELLCCPLCKGELKLQVGKKSKEEIITGTLTCKECSATYPIEDAIPNLLPPDEREPAKG